MVLCSEGFAQHPSKSSPNNFDKTPPRRPQELPRHLQGRPGRPSTPPDASKTPRMSSKTSPSGLQTDTWPPKKPYFSSSFSTISSFEALGPSRHLHGPSWRHLVTSWRRLGPSWRCLGPSWTHLGLPKNSQNRSKNPPRPSQDEVQLSSKLRSNLEAFAEQK